MSLYLPEYDGTAAQYGFRTGDMIVGLEVCESVSSCDADTACDVTMAEVQRRMVEISGNTSDEEWISYAQSCELLQPGSDSVLHIRRRITK